MLKGDSPVARYGVAVAVVCAVAAVRWLVDPLMGVESPLLLFVIAVLVAAWFGGGGPGLVATALAALVGGYLFLPPQDSLQIGGSGYLVNLGLFVVEGVVISAIVAEMRSARRRSNEDAIRAQEASERSERSEEGFRLLVEGARDYAIVMLTPEGRVASWNEGAERILGYPEDEILGKRFAVFFTPEDRSSGLPERELERAMEEGTTSGEGWAVRKDGTRLWANGSTSALRDGSGDLRGLVRVIHDRTEARRAEEELRLRDRAIAASANGVVISDPNAPDNPIVYVNPAFEKLSGYAADEVLGRNCRFLQGEDRDQPGLEELRAAIRERRSCEVVLRNYTKDGSLLYNELTVSPVFDEEGRLTRFIGIQNDVTDRERAEAALGVLAEAGGVLATPLDYQGRLQGLARLVVPRLADWCTVDVVEDDGSVRRLAVEHREPAMAELVHDLEQRYPVEPHKAHGVRRVLQTGEAELEPEVSEDLLREIARNEAHLSMLRRLGPKSYMILPMVARGRTLGAMTFVWSESGRSYGEEELALARTLVRRATTAVENARLYEAAQREISEREQVEDELRKSEARLRLATETTGLGTFDFYPETGELSWDERCREIFGLSPGARVDYGIFLSVIHPDDRDQADEAVRRALDRSGDGGFGTEYRVVRFSDGVERWVEARGRVFFRDGEPHRFTGTVLDVTEEKLSEEALRRSEERYRAVIEQSAEGIFLFDVRTRRVLESNPTLQAMLGYDADELRGMEFYDLVAHSREDVDANIGRTLEVGRRLMEDRTYRRKDGTLVNVEVGVSTISYNSHQAICATVRDVTGRRQAEEALRRSEERLRSLVRYASDIIVILDGEGKILYESAAVERVLGFTPQERMGNNAFDFLHPEDRAPVTDRFAKLAGEPGARVSAEYRTRNKEGDWRSFEAIGVNLLDDPVVQGIVVNTRDVTERKRTEQAMSEIRDAERGRMARDLHDGVLQDLSYTAQAMEVTRVKYDGTGVETDLEEAAQAIRRAARDLREAIYDLRAYRDDGQDVVQLFESLIELNRRRMPGRTIEAALETGLLATLSERGGTELLRVVQEALTNVRRHSGARNVRVVLSSSDDTLGVEVSDDGSGFDPEALPPGVGTLGMRERALGLGGRLEVESEPGSGTTVRFEAPLENLRR